MKFGTLKTVWTCDEDKTVKVNECRTEGGVSVTGATGEMDQEWMSIGEMVDR